MNGGLSSGSGTGAKLGGNKDRFQPSGAFMLLRRLTITWLLIAGLAIVAGLFADRKHDTDRDQTVFGPLASVQTKPGQRP